ncbi:MAG: DPP IV N-terminal domain-containing protein [bacterium]|nr:DPP IV N-terminal domain-containing protein [bacterium]
MKKIKFFVEAAIFCILASICSAQKQYVIYSQSVAGGGYSDVVCYDTATGETFLVTGFSKTDSGAILSISSAQNFIYFTRSSIPNGRPNPAIWRVYIDGSGLTDFLSPDPEISYKHVAVSPDGNTIAYTANDRENPSIFQIYVCNSDGTNRRRLTLDPTWDCSYPVFISNDTVLFKVKKGFLEDYYTATLSGVVVNLTNNESVTPYFPRIGKPSVNFDRNMIIYAKQEQDISGYKKWAIYTLSPLDGTGTEQMITDALYFTQSDPLLQEDPCPAFYGTGNEQILFCGSLTGNVYDLYTVNIPVINPYLAKLTDGNFHINLPVTIVKTPAKQRYVYLQNGYVYVRNETGNPVRLTSGSGNRHPSINTRGTMVSYASQTGLYVIRPDGTSLIQIDSNVSADYPEFSPDGLWVFYLKNSDIYAKRSDGSGSSIRLTYTGNVEGDIKFSPTGQELVFTGLVNLRKHIFICPVQFSYGQPMTVTAGTPRDLTPLTGDNHYPSFSPDGETIVFVSTRNQIPELWLMKKDGTQQRKIMFSTGVQNPASPCFSNSSPDIIYYVAGTPQQIFYADLSQQQITPVSTGIVAEHIQTSAMPYGVIEGERIIGIKETDPYVPITYYLLMHVDKIPLPSSAILTEVIPDGWRLKSVRINGIVPVQMTSNGATTGQLKWLFGPAGIAPLQDSVIQITIEHSNPSSQTYGEYKSFAGWCETSGVRAFTKGNSNIIIANPFIPVDINKDWKISDEELLYTIYLWANNGRISLWPEYISEWDFLLLSIISFWANPDGYTYNLTDSRSQGKYLWKKQ